MSVLSHSPARTFLHNQDPKRTWAATLSVILYARNPAAICYPQICRRAPPPPLFAVRIGQLHATKRFRHRSWWHSDYVVAQRAGAAVKVALASRYAFVGAGHVTGGGGASTRADRSPLCPGTNSDFEFRGAAGRADRLAELIASEVDVIFASGSEATRAARQKTTTIPIVTISTNPVGLDLSPVLPGPGGISPA